MTHRFKNTLRSLTKHFGLKVRFVHYFDDQTYGKLLVREKRILLNARKPRIEHFYTILHELGHFVVHHQNPPRDYCPGYLRKKWSRKSINDTFKKARRYLRYAFGCSAGKEWEADLWAICAFILLTKHLGCWSELQGFMDRHPEKLKTFYLAAGTMIFIGVKNRILKFAGKLLLPFKAF